DPGGNGFEDLSRAVHRDRGTDATIAHVIVPSVIVAPTAHVGGRRRGGDPPSAQHKQMPFGIHAQLSKVDGHGPVRNDLKTSVEINDFVRAADRLFAGLDIEQVPVVPGDARVARPSTTKPSTTALAVG